MAYYNTTMTPNAIGVLTVPNGFQGKGMRVTVSSNSGTETINHKSVGMVDDSGWMTYHSNFTDGSGSQTKSGIDRIVSHFRRVSGVVTEVNSGTFHSFNPTNTKLNVTKVTSTYEWNIEIWD